MNTQKQIFLMVVLMFVFVGGCAAYTVIDLPVRAEDQTVWHHEQSVERGALLYANNCRTCHGLQGEGGVGLPLNRLVSTEAKDFQNQDPLVLANNRALLQRTLTCGRAGTRMPAWLNTNGGSLNSEQIKHLVNFLTQPADPELLDANGSPTSEGWHLAEEFAHNLNHETTVVVGGETLSSIAKDHRVGVAQVADIAKVGPNDIVKKGTTLRLPDGREYLVRTGNETPTKIADNQHVGEVILAQLNNIPYRVDEKTNRFILLAEDGETVLPGLFPGTQIKLPESSPYIVKTGDTLQSIADHHGLQLRDLATGDNTKIVGTTDAAQPLDSVRKLSLPTNAVAVVQPGQTLAAIAALHAITPEVLATENGIQVADVVEAGSDLKLPSGAKYVIQSGDTLASVASTHKVSADELASANGLQPNEAISPEVVITLPSFNVAGEYKYTITGQTLEEVSAGYSNVTAASLAEANGGIPENAILRVGQTLALPADAWGSAAPDAVNPGTACVQHTVPDAVFSTLPGVGSPTPDVPVVVPTDVARDVTVEAGALDWHIIADGTTSELNRGVALVAKGTAVKFFSKVGLHTITINAKKDGADLKQGDTRTITFNTSGNFKITCDYHPTMIATIVVQ